ncbi:MAG: NAD-dependent epimerase/dehydratase family protein, partial [Chloroflexota bacterium]
MQTATLQPTRGLSMISADMPEILETLGTDITHFSGKTVLITGASGVLPSYCADTIAYANRNMLAEPAKLLLLVRSFPTHYGRLAHLVGRDDVSFVVQDVREPLEINGPLDFVIHAASPAAPRKFAEDPVGTLDANSYALRGLLELTRMHEVESFLFFSSSEIYGNPEPENIPTPETYIGRFDFALARSFYAEAKRFGETLCRAYCEMYGVPTRVVRPFHVHGPGLRADDGRIVADMMVKGLEGKPLKLASNGAATRTYGYISDATVGFLKVLLNGQKGEAYNVGADKPEVSILDLTKLISQLCGRTDSVEVSKAASPQGSPGRVCPDLSKIQRSLGFEPKVELSDGLTRTISWFRTQTMDKV